MNQHCHLPFNSQLFFMGKDLVKSGQMLLLAATPAGGLLHMGLVELTQSGLSALQRSTLAC